MLGQARKRHITISHALNSTQICSSLLPEKKKIQPMNKQHIKIQQFIKLIRNNTDSPSESPKKLKYSLRDRKVMGKGRNSIHQKVNFCVSPEHFEFSPLKKQVSEKDALKVGLDSFCSLEMDSDKLRLKNKMTRNQVNVKFPQLNLVKETLDVKQRSPEPKEEKRRKLKHMMLLEKRKKVRKSSSLRCPLTEGDRLDPMNLSGWNDGFQY